MMMYFMDWDPYSDDKSLSTYLQNVNPEDVNATLTVYNILKTATLDNDYFKMFTKW